LRGLDRFVTQPESNHGAVDAMLEKVHGTRNVRLSAIHAFFRFVASRNPEHLDLAQRILGIPFKRAAQRAIDYLEYDEIDAVLKSIKRSTPQGAETTRCSR